MVNSSHSKGFTLIELSIVLVVIGLVVGGVIVGREMIEGARIRSQVAEINEYKAAAGAFRVKFNCIPGDCTKASDFGFSVNIGGDTTTNGNGMDILKQALATLQMKV